MVILTWTAAHLAVSWLCAAPRPRHQLGRRREWSLFGGTGVPPVCWSEFSGLLSEMDCTVSKQIVDPVERLRQQAHTWFLIRQMISDSAASQCANEFVDRVDSLDSDSCDAMSAILCEHPPRQMTLEIATSLRGFHLDMVSSSLQRVQHPGARLLLFVVCAECEALCRSGPEPNTSLHGFATAMYVASAAACVSSTEAIVSCMSFALNELAACLLQSEDLLDLRVADFATAISRSMLGPAEIIRRESRIPFDLLDFSSHFHAAENCGAFRDDIEQASIEFGAWVFSQEFQE